MPLIFSRQTFGVKEVRDGRASHQDRFPQNCLERAVEFLGLRRLQARAKMGRVNPGFPQAFVRVDVSNAPQDTLIEQQSFDARVAPANSMQKLFQPGFQRIGPKPSQFFLERFAGEIRHAPESPR